MGTSGRGGVRQRISAEVIALGLTVGGCGDDGGVMPTSSSSSGGVMSTSTSAGPGSSDDSGSSTTSITTGVDSTGTGTTTTGVDSTGTGTTTTGTTGMPNLPPEPGDDVYFVRVDQAPLAVDAAAGVLANDVEPDGEALTVDGADAASVAGGTVVVQPDGAFDYTPPADFFGDDSFEYTVRDESGATAMATVRITVGPVAVELGDLDGGMGGFVIDGAVADGEAGIAVGGGGDVNGDGLDDVLVTSVEADGGAGRVWVVFGKADGAPVDLGAVDLGMGGFSILGEVAGDQAGHAVAIVDDVDGDDLADVLVGAPMAGTAGRAYLVFGKADGASVDLADVAMSMGGFVLEGDGFGELAGTAVAGGGDVNGDGLGDLLVGAPLGGPIPGGGRTYVVFGKTNANPVDLAQIYIGIGGFAIHGAGFDDNAGDSVAGVGDVDADGLSDVLVGARYANPGGMGNAGRCYVVFGKTSTGVVDLSGLGGGGFFINGEAGFDEACTAVSGAGDVDGDGRADLVVGSPGAENGVAFQGRAYVVRGKDDSATVQLSDIAAGMGGYAIDGEDVGDFLGQAAAGGGDIDGDGFGDVVLGATNVNVPGTLAGRGYVVFGQSGGATVPLADLTVRLGGFSIEAGQAFTELGWRVANAGDVDGDGYADVVLSAHGADSPAGADAGRSYVVFGGNFSGATTHLGGDGDDLIVATPGLDVVVGGAGADQIHGEGGGDVIYGGAGDDRIGLIDGQFFRVDGGSGYDTLALDDDNVDLDLGLVPDAALRDLEAIDISGTGDNILTFGLRDLRAIVGASRTLRLLGDNTDAVQADLTDGGFVDEGIAGGVHTWTNGRFTLEVVEPLGALVIL